MRSIVICYNFRSLSNKNTGSHTFLISKIRIQNYSYRCYPQNENRCKMRGGSYEANGRYLSVIGRFIYVHGFICRPWRNTTLRRTLPRTSRRSSTKSTTPRGIALWAGISAPTLPTRPGTLSTFTWGRWPFCCSRVDRCLY